MVVVKISIEGKSVQGIGYRMFLLEKALLQGIEKFYAQNVDRNKVELSVSDEEGKINGFYKVISLEKPKNARVSGMRKEPYEGDVLIPPIDRYLQFLTLEQLSRGREEVVTLPQVIVKAMAPVASALMGINEKFTDVVDRFGVFGQYAKGLDEKMTRVDEKLKGVDEKLDKIATLPEKIDTLPERIAEAMGVPKKKS